MVERSSTPAAAFALLVLSGCASVGPDFVPPDPMLPATSFFGKPQPATAQAASSPSDLPGLDPRWWAVFHDPILTSLAERVASANLDVRTATLRLAESRFDRGVTASAEYPSINGNASYQRELYSQNGVLSLIKPFVPATTPFVIPPISIWQTGLDASWELDIWGRVRRQIETADAQVEATEEQRRDALVSSLAELARDYIELRGVQAQIAIAKANLASSSDILQLTKTRAEKGLTTGLDVQNAAAQVDSIRATLPTLEDQESTQINALSLLLDEPPGALREELARAKPIPPTPPRVPLGLPSELARRRPDIRQAEAQLHAATATIGVAVASFYPSVTLSGNIELNALDLRNLWKGSSLQYVFGPTISLPIFEGGRLTSTLELREAQQQEAAIAYHKTVLQAWHEVVNALVAYRTEQERREHLRAQTDHSRQALSLSRARYTNGVADFISVLDAERTVLAAELQYAQSTTTVSTNLVQLYKALGGGWETTFPQESVMAAVHVPPVP
ncbi:MAG TPA: efflux transporter outer membrane subunit [Methylocella sp.]|nr:efflux transporter outer membrane subunit [Methylocella sp.]